MSFDMAEPPYKRGKWTARSSLIQFSSPAKSNPVILGDGRVQRAVKHKKNTSTWALTSKPPECDALMTSKKPQMASPPPPAHPWWQKASHCCCWTEQPMPNPFPRGGGGQSHPPGRCFGRRDGDCGLERPGRGRRTGARQGLGHNPPTKASLARHQIHVP